MASNNAQVTAATHAIAEPLVAATKMADRATLGLAWTITTLIEEVDVRKLDILAGAEQLPLVAAALLKQTEARQAALTARVAMFKEARRLGVTAFGPDCICTSATSDAPLAATTVAPAG